MYPEEREYLPLSLCVCVTHIGKKPLFVQNGMQYVNMIMALLNIQLPNSQKRCNNVSQMDRLNWIELSKAFGVVFAAQMCMCIYRLLLNSPLPCHCCSCCVTRESIKWFHMFICPWACAVPFRAGKNSISIILAVKSNKLHLLLGTMCVRALLYSGKLTNIIYCMCKYRCMLWKSLADHFKWWCYKFAETFIRYRLNKLNTMCIETQFEMPKQQRCSHRCIHIEWIKSARIY